jgi:hypothetical protein
VQEIPQTDTAVPASKPGPIKIRMPSSISYAGNGRGEVGFHRGGMAHGLPHRLPVPELDRLKEQLAYLKLWQGIVVVTDISLVGWLISAADTAARPRVLFAVLGVILLSLGIVVLHRQIHRRLEQIGRL